MREHQAVGCVNALIPCCFATPLQAAGEQPASYDPQQQQPQQLPSTDCETDEQLLPAAKKQRMSVDLHEEAEQQVQRTRLEVAKAKQELNITGKGAAAPPAWCVLRIWCTLQSSCVAAAWGWLLL